MGKICANKSNFSINLDHSPVKIQGVNRSTQTFRNAVLTFSVRHNSTWSGDKRAAVLRPMRADPPADTRIPLLDGIRAVAIGLVVLGHSINSPNRQVLSAMTGTFGVSVFFVLSGYLITRTMLADERIHGKLRFGQFLSVGARCACFPHSMPIIVLAGLSCDRGFLTGPDHA